MMNDLSCPLDTSIPSTGFDDIPCELIQQIADSYLNPAERSRLSCCSKRFHHVLPPLLRIKIVSTTTTATATAATRDESQLQDSTHEDTKHQFRSLMSAFFVTPVEDYDCKTSGDDYDEESPSRHDYSYPRIHSSNNSNHEYRMQRTLTASDNLVYGQRYYFWTFDYQRGNRVFLGRHTRHGMKNHETGMLQHRYSLGLRPKSPNQTWQVMGGENGEDQDGNVVMWGDEIGLSVGGTNSRPRLPDSKERNLLSCLPPQEWGAAEAGNPNTNTNNNNEEDGGSSSWCVVQNEWGTNERLQLIPVDQFVPGPDVQEKELSIHAIPEACDEGEYLLHSPASLQDGLATCDGFHVIVNFEFWMEKGVMNFYAPALPFALGIPILESDYCTDRNGDYQPWNSSTTGPISNLLDIKSARWGCLIYYMAVAADVTEGKTLDIGRFLRRVTDHDDHTVKINERMDYVYIDVKGKKVNQKAPEIPRDFCSDSNTATSWCFVLSW